MRSRIKSILSSENFRNFLVRSLSTAVIIPIAVYILVIGGDFFSLFISILGAGMIWEMARAIFGAVHSRFLIILSIGFGVVILLTGLRVGILLLSTVALLFLVLFSIYCLVIKQVDKITKFLICSPVSYTHLTLPTTPYV